MFKRNNKGDEENSYIEIAKRMRGRRRDVYLPATRRFVMRSPLRAAKKRPSTKKKAYRNREHSVTTRREKRRKKGKGD